eukprot:gene20388-24420_t
MSQKSSAVAKSTTQFPATLAKLTSWQKTADFKITAKQIEYIDKKGSKARCSINGLLYLYKMFRAIDLDNSGTISQDEVDDFEGRLFNRAVDTLALVALFEGDSIQKNSVGVFLKFMRNTLAKRSRISFIDFLKIAQPHANFQVILEMNKIVMRNEMKNRCGLSAAREQDRRKALQEELRRQRAWVESMWVVWDNDGNGELDGNEFKAVMLDIGADITEAESFFAEIDDDGSGLISKSEFLAWWAAIHVLANTQVDLALKF